MTNYLHPDRDVYALEECLYSGGREDRRWQLNSVAIHPLGCIVAISDKWPRLNCCLQANALIDRETNVLSVGNSEVTI